MDLEARRLGLAALHLPFLSEWDPLSAARLRAAAARTPAPTVLHAHTAHTAALAYLASRFRGPPWVVHRRVDFPLSGSLSRRFKYDPAAAVFSISEAITRVLAEAGVSADRIHTVHSCIPVGEEEAGMAGLESPIAPASPGERTRIREDLGRRWGIPPGAPWIGNMAALVPHKDQATLLRSVPGILSRLPDARVFFVGEGPLRAGLERLARELGVLDSVRFVGYQSERLPWLKALDLFALSSWGEGMGSVLLEAAACRLPIVATAAGGIPEVVEDGVTGTLAPPASPEALGRAIVSALRDPDRARAMAEEGLRRLQRFSLRRCGEAVENVYRRVLARW